MSTKNKTVVALDVDKDKLKAAAAAYAEELSEKLGSGFTVKVSMTDYVQAVVNKALGEVDPVAQLAKS